VSKSYKKGTLTIKEELLGYHNNNVEALIFHTSVCAQCHPSTQTALGTPNSQTMGLVHGTPNNINICLEDVQNLKMSKILKQ